MLHLKRFTSSGLAENSEPKRRVVKKQQSVGVTQGHRFQFLKCSKKPCCSRNRSTVWFIQKMMLSRLRQAAGYFSIKLLDQKTFFIMIFMQTNPIHDQTPTHIACFLHFNSSFLVQLCVVSFTEPVYEALTSVAIKQLSSTVSSNVVVMLVKTLREQVFQIRLLVKCFITNFTDEGQDDHSLCGLHLANCCLVNATVADVAASSFHSYLMNVCRQSSPS